MSTSLVYHTQQIRGFQHQCFIFKSDKVIQKINRKQFRCRHCHCPKVTVRKTRTRQVQALPYGLKKSFIEFDVHRVYCHKCKVRDTEDFHFLPQPKSRITKAFERTLVELRPMMSITDIAKYFEVDWRIIKAAEKVYLEKKYAKVPLKDVTVIGIDEIHVHKKADKDKNKEKYITIVRDLVSGAVLHVGQGKGVESLAPFQKKLRKSKCKITLVAMDMSRAFTSWAESNLPNALIIYDHFHVIKSMNEKVDAIRRRVCKELDDKNDEEKRKALKGKRYLFLYGEERLSTDDRSALDQLREEYKDLADATSIKEELRSIYRNCNNAFEAEIRLKKWIDTAKRTEVPELVKMTDTVEKHFDGILAYWKSNGITSAAMEGFNNKVRWLIRQSYGFHDEEYFHLKIFDLPTIKITKGL